MWLEGLFRRFHCVSLCFNGLIVYVILLPPPLSTITSSLWMWLLFPTSTTRSPYLLVASSLKMYRMPLIGADSQVALHVIVADNGISAIDFHYRWVLRWMFSIRYQYFFLYTVDYPLLGDPCNLSNEGTFSSQTVFASILNEHTLLMQASFLSYWCPD